MHLSDELLSAYLDGEMTPVEATAARSHLGQCASCSGALRLYAALDEGLAATPALRCADAAAFLSAKLDGELGPEEAAIASTHLAGCAACRADVSDWSALERGIATLPVAHPSKRVDAAIAALVREPAVRRVPRLGAAIPSVAVVTALTLLLVASLPTASPVPPIDAQQTQQQPLVAAVQQVLNPNTNTLYVLQPERATVSARDASTGEEKSSIFVGGAPTTLTLNLATNTVLVLDASNKTVTELDGGLKAVTSATVVPMPGTPTSIQVDQTSGKVVIGAVATDATLPASPVGIIATLDGGTKQVETVREIEVAPSVIVPDPNGSRVLLVSPKSTILADASSYRALLSTVGGVGAAFSASRSDFVVLSNSPAGAKLTFAGTNNSVTLGGTPRAVIALPGGGFAILADLQGAGVISVVNADGVLSTTMSAPRNGRDLAYDPTTRKFSVIGATSVTAVSAPEIVQAPPRNATGSPLPTVQPPTASPQESAKPSSSASPSATPTPAPTEATVVLAPKESDNLVPPGARALWPGTYFVSGVRRPMRAIADGERIWYVDDANRVWALHTEGNEVFNVAVLPRSSTITHLAVSSNHVYFLDAPANTLHVLTISTERLATVTLPIPTVANAIIGSPDDRLWLATKGSGLVAFDPRNSRIDMVTVGFELSVIGVDTSGRVWTASRDRQSVDLYDTLTGKLTEYSLGHSGAITALAVDRTNVVWVGTSTGEVIGLRAGASGAASLVATGAVGRGVSALVLDNNGALYAITRAAGGVTYGPVRAPALTATTPTTSSEPMFDVTGRVWQADGSVGGFYVTLPGARP